MASNADTGYGKEYVASTGIDINNHVTRVVLDDGIWVCCSIVYQEVSFVDRVGCRFRFLSGYLIRGGYHSGINCSGILHKGALYGLDSLFPRWVKVR